MKVISASELRTIGIRLFVACGAPEPEAAIVSDELVESSLMGFDSHGIIRFPQYVDTTLSGVNKPGAPIQVVQETATTALVDCGFNYGQVGAARMAELAIEKAQAMNLACIVSKDCNHVGRLGAWPQRVAARGLFGLAVVTNPLRGHWVLPFGGSERRLGTNPIAYAAPTSSDPIMLDMSTCVLPEGKIRMLLQQGKPVPNGVLVDSQGNPSNNPADLYGPPRGSLLPIGGEFGYKGFGLGLLVEILGNLLAGYAASQDYPHQNGLCLIAINPDAFCGRERFRELLDDLTQFMTSTPPTANSRGVMMPGAPEFATKRKRLAEGIPVADETWRLLVQAGEKCGVGVDGSQWLIL